MKRIVRLAAAVFLASAFAACTLQLEKPESGAVERYAKGAPVDTRALTGEQLSQLASWLDRHQSGWSPSYVSYVPHLLIRVKYADGNEGTVNIFTSGFVIVRSAGRQFTHSFGEAVVGELVSSIDAE